MLMPHCTQRVLTDHPHLAPCLPSSPHFPHSPCPPYSAPCPLPPFCPPAPPTPNSGPTPLAPFWPLILPPHFWPLFPHSGHHPPVYYLFMLPNDFSLTTIENLRQNLLISPQMAEFAEFLGCKCTSNLKCFCANVNNTTLVQYKVRFTEDVPQSLVPGPFRGGGTLRQDRAHPDRTGVPRDREGVLPDRIG